MSTPWPDPLILHIASADDRRQLENASYSPPSLETEGFIHCSTPAQVVKTADRFYRDAGDLILICIDANKVEAAVEYEEGEPGELFPHIHGPLNTDAIVRVVPMERGRAGGCLLPDELRSAL